MEQIGRPDRPGQVEGANIDPVVVEGETEIKRVNLIDKKDYVRVIAPREDSNDMLIVADEHSAFNNVEPTPWPYVITYNNLAGGTFAVGDTVTGSISASTSEVIYDDGAGVMVVKYINGDFDAATPDQIDNGGGVTADVTAWYAAPSAGDTGMLANQSKVLYFNGNDMINMTDVVYHDATATIPTNNNYTQRHYKINDAAWAPNVSSTPYEDRLPVARMDRAESLADMCLLVGEHKYLETTGGVGTNFRTGALILFRPALAAQVKNIDDTGGVVWQFSPVAYINGDADLIAFNDVEFFSACWDAGSTPKDTTDDSVLLVAYAVGTHRDGTTYTPKAYRIEIKQPLIDLLDNNLTTPFAYSVTDLRIEDSQSFKNNPYSGFDDGVLFGCHFDVNRRKLFVTGSRMNAGTTTSRQIFAEFDTQTNSWRDRSARLGVTYSVQSNGSDGFLVQNEDGLKLVSNSASFISDGIKRGTCIWIDITDYNTGTTASFNTPNGNTMQSGLFFVRGVLSETELILDKRMPNTMYVKNSGATMRAIFTSMFDWGYLYSENGYIVYGDTLTGTFNVGDLVTGGTSGETGTVVSTDGRTMRLSGVSGPFTIGEAATGPTGALTVLDYYTGINSSDDTIVVEVCLEMIDDPGATVRTFPAGGGTVMVDDEQITYTSATVTNARHQPYGTGTPFYKQYTLAGCTRGANNSSATYHRDRRGPTNTQYPPSALFGADAPHVPDARTVISLCTNRSYRAFTRMDSMTQTADGLSLLLSGDSGVFKRYDIDTTTFYDISTRIDIPGNVNLGKIRWKPDRDRAYVIANRYNASYVYRYGSGWLQQISVPTAGILLDMAWTPDGMSAYIGGDVLYKMTKKVNVAMADRESAVMSRKMIFNSQEVEIPFDGTYPPMQASEVLNVGDLDPDTLMMYVEVNPSYTAGLTPTELELYDFEMRVYVAPDGISTDDFRRYYWKSFTLNDIAYYRNPTHMNPDDVKGLVYYNSRKMFKLPPYARYVAIETVWWSWDARPPCFLTVGVQGGVQ